MKPKNLRKIILLSSLIIFSIIIFYIIKNPSNKNFYYDGIDSFKNTLLVANI